MKMRSLVSYRIWASAVALSLAGAQVGCAGGAGKGSSSEAVGEVALSVSQRGQMSISRIALTIGPGDGPAFTPFTIDLAKTGATWGADVTGVPVGKGRLFSVSAFDAGGTVVESGSAKCDILAGETAQVEIQIGSQPPPPYENAVPVLDFLVASRTRVAPGQQVALGVSAHDPDPGDVVTFLWAASCGDFDSTTRSDPTWTAPGQPGTCHLSITASDNRGGSVMAPLDIVVAIQREVVGTRLVTYWPDPPAAKVTAPAPEVVTGAAPFIVSQDGSGGWATLPGGHLAADGSFVSGSYGLDGSFVIPNPPEGVHAFCYPEPDGALACSDTAEDQIDLGYDVLGRADQSRATAPTPIQLTFSGLNDWNPLTDRLQLTSSGANLWDELVPGFRGGVTAGEATEDWFYPAIGTPLGLLAAADTLFVHQLSTRSFYLNGKLMLYVAATQATPAPPDPASLIGISLTSGQQGALAASLVRLPLAGTAAIDWDMPAFEACLGAMGPAQRITTAQEPHLLVVDANAFPLEYPAPAPARGSPELVVLALPAGLGRLSEALYYGQFLPPLWHEGLGVRYAAQVTYLAPGATTPLVETATVERHDPMPGPTTIAPAVGPVGSPRLNGDDALVDRAAAATLTPTFSWTAPTRGAPTSYRLELFRLAASGTESLRTPVLRYSTSALQVTVPPGVLQAGATYYARIVAQVSDVPFDEAPLRWTAVSAEASTFTGIFNP